jgi:very-short-patch-repair endonuclease
VPERADFPVGWTAVRRSELHAVGISNARIRTAVRTGRWQEPLRGVVVGHSGPLTQRERWSAALSYAGPESYLSHHSALRLWGARSDELAARRRVAGVLGDYEAPAEGGMVEVTRVHGQHMSSHGFVVVHQSRRPVDGTSVSGLVTTCAARAAVDVALTALRRRDVDHVLADVLQKGLATVDELVAETRLAGKAATRWLRAAVADVLAGTRSVGETELRRVVRRAGLPEPEWSAPISTSAGTYYVDALWRDRSVVAEADGQGYHLSAADWQADLRRQNALHGAGLVVLRYPVRRLREESAACADELRRLVA